MINPINPSVLRTNDALSKQQRHHRQCNRKREKQQDDSHDPSLNPEEEEHLNLVA
jgi:hypothetical protein